MADIAELGLKINSQPVEQAGAKLKNFGKIASDTERKVLQSTNGMATGFKSFNTSVKSASPVVTTFEKTAKTATATSGNFSNSIRQISLQLSQVAQQGAVTGDFFRAFTVQLPDLLLGFGTFGILIGAVAGALGGPLLDALTATNSETDKLFKSIREGNADLEQLGEAQRELFTKEQEKKIKETKEGIEEYTKKLGDAERALVDLRTKGKFDSTGFFPRFKKADQDDLDEAQSKILTLRASIEGQNQELKNQEQLLKDVADANKKAYEQKEADRQIGRQQDIVRELEATTSAIQRAGSTQTEIAVRAASERNSILANAYSKDLISFNEYRAQRAENQFQLQKELTEIDENGSNQRIQLLTETQQATLSLTAGLMGQAASILRSGGEEQFQQYKNLASAQAAISASLAIANVLAADSKVYGSAAIPLAIATGALAAAQIAQIQSQEYTSSRASGGQAKGRVLVGENGPEILDMGSRTGVITSAAGTKNELNSGQPVQQIFNISPGIEGTVRAEIEQFIPVFRQIAVQAGVSNVRSGGAMARAVGRR